MSTWMTIKGIFFLGPVGALFCSAPIVSVDRTTSSEVLLLFTKLISAGYGMLTPRQISNPWPTVEGAIADEGGCSGGSGNVLQIC